jgi:pimeloyl-ACP methyl ester carboxylesterase
MRHCVTIRGLRALVSMLLVLPSPARAEAMLADFTYPHAVQKFEFRAQSLDVAMAYMDVKPNKPNGRTVVLLHGKNFCGATWESVIKTVTEAGYRAIVPDQIGFCKSSKPNAYHYSLHDLASNTSALIKQLGIERPIIIGHSMGGMLAFRYALSYPNALSGLVVVNPIGLEDWRAKGVPDRTFDELYEAETKTDAAKIKAYQQKVYYNGQWKPEYERWVTMLASMYSGADGATVAWAQALTSKMVFSDPVVHEFGLIRTPTTLLIGERDITAIGRDRVTPEVAATLGNYPALARDAAAKIKGAQLVTFPTLGHSPHVEDPPAFNAALLSALAKL